MIAPAHVYSLRVELPVRLSRHIRPRVLFSLMSDGVYILSAAGAPNDLRHYVISGHVFPLYSTVSMDYPR